LRRAKAPLLTCSGGPYSYYRRNLVISRRPRCDRMMLLANLAVHGGWAVAGKIFINYRRDDSIATAGRLHDRLAQTFGRNNLFMDVDHMPAGADFVGYLSRQVIDSDVFLVVIGPLWLNARDDEGIRRIDKPDDFVAIEIAAALSRDIRVIPVLVDGAQMPKVGQLPEDLQALAHRNAVDVRNAQFGRDAEVLIGKVRDVLRTKQSGRGLWWQVAAGVVALALVGVLAGITVPWIPSPWSAGKLATAGAEAEREVRPGGVLGSPPRNDGPSKDQSNLAGSSPVHTDAAGKWATNPWVAIPGQPVRQDKGDRLDRLASRWDRLLAAKPKEDRWEPSLADVEKPPPQSKTKDVFKECDECPAMVVAPAGSFTMGSPGGEPQRSRDEVEIRIAIAKPFAVGQYAVTFDEWDACVADGGCGNYKPPDEGWGRGRRPVINVSYDNAKQYVAWLSSKTGKAYRLLSEAEREYVTRAGTTTPFWWGSAITPQQANYDGSAQPYEGGGSRGEYRRRTVPVDSFGPNPWGLYNVHGNVWEWTEDCWSATNGGNPQDGSARESGDCSKRSLRGGSWLSNPTNLRAASRLGDASGDSNFGFRVARTLSP
jgi:formylglycine-generating enzyme required for sulfatase activity